MTDRKNKIVELGSVRGIAAIMVLLSHALFLYRTPSWFTTFSEVFNGRAAVVVFFVLSGFVLTRSLGGSKITGSSLIGFYCKRFFRIYPAIWAASALGMCYLIWVNFSVHSPEASQFFQSRFRPERYDRAFILSSFAGLSAYILPPLWSIFVELIASLLMPLIAFVAFQRKRFFLGATLLALVTSFLVGGDSYYGVALYLVYFFFGAAIAVLPVGIRDLLKSPQLPVGAIALVTLGLLLSSEILIKGNFTPIGAFYEGSLAFILITLIVHSRANFLFLRSRWAVQLGDLSYSVYLIHFTVACVAMKLLDAMENGEVLVLPTIAKALLVAVLTLSVSVPLASLCHTYVEKPGIQLGRWLDKRIQAGLTDKPWLGKVASSLPHAMTARGYTDTSANS